MERQRWSSRTIFLFAAIGSAVGLGNLWRFPYFTYKYGGGAFLIPYFIVLFLLGVPLLLLEFAIGQKLQKGAVNAFRSIHSKLTGVGISAVYSSFIVVVYYAVIMAWALLYLVNSFSVAWASNPEVYFFDAVLQVSESISVIGGINLFVLLALVVVWVMIYYCIRNGVKSVGKVVMITMPVPLFLLVILFFRGITLDGAFTGLYYFLRPDFAALLNPEIWLAAVSQIFFTLSLAFGIMVAYASYNDESEDIVKSAYSTALANSGISLLAGFVVFSVLGYMSSVTGTPVADVATQGPGLAFVVFPQALSLMPLASFFSVLFFLTILTLGIDSAFSLVESVSTVFSDNLKASKKKIAFWVCTGGFVFGVIFTTNAGLYFLDLVDHFITSYALVMVGIFECIAVGWVYGASKMRSYVNKVSDRKIGVWWETSIKFIVPAVLFVLMVFQIQKEMVENYGGFPDWAMALGWGIVLLPLLIAYFFLRREMR